MLWKELNHASKMDPWEIFYEHIHIGLAVGFVGISTNSWRKWMVVPKTGICMMAILGSEKVGVILQTTILNSFSYVEIVVLCFISRGFSPKDLFNNTPSLVQVLSHHLHQ